MGKEIKILALAIFAAPYRSALFSYFSKKVKVDGFYERDNDYGRVGEFFNEEGFTTLNSEKSRAILEEKLEDISQYNAIVLYDFTSPLSRRIMRKAIKARIPYFVNCDGVIIGKKKNILANIVKRFYVKRATKCFASGKYAKDYFVKLGAKDENVVIHNFTTLVESDIREKPLSKEQKNEIRNKYNLPTDKTIFVGVGRFISVKNYEFLLENFKCFSNDSFLLLIGGGELEGLYQSIIEKNNISNISLMNFVEKEKLLEILSCCDFLVHPTTYDAWGLVVNESMSQGLPVISSNTCVAALELVNNSNGFISDSATFEKAINGAEDLYKNKAKYEQYCINSINTIKNYTINNMGKVQLDEILKAANC